MTEVEDAKASALAPTRAAPSDLSYAACSRNDGAEVRRSCEDCLKQAVGVVGAESPYACGDGMGLNEDHRGSMRQWLRGI